MSEPELIGVQHALALIDQTPVTPRIIDVALLDAQGMVLAEDLMADRDYPPFEKSLMDGYAVRSADVATGSADLRVVGEIAAGQWPDRAIGVGETMAIMTGAPLPASADGVVPVEDVAGRVAIGQAVKVLRAVSPQRFVGHIASDCPAGRIVLSRGTMLAPAQIAVAASVGAVHVRCYARPRVAILGTGDEIVPIDQTPGRSQIRDSNTPMLIALLRRLGCEVAAVETVADDPAQLRAALVRGMSHDALFITGGMSMGVYDYVPSILAELGVELKITKLRIKPGKPFVFGVAGEGRGDGGMERGGEGEMEGGGDGGMEGGRDGGMEGGGATEGGGDGETGGRRRDRGKEGGGREDEIRWNTQATTRIEASLRLPLPPSPPPSVSPSHRRPLRSFVFGLPGNPVSAFVCTHRFASRLLARMAGGTPMERWQTGQLDADLPANGPREFYQPAVIRPAEAQHSGHAELPRITPLAWKGSADIFTLAAANALLVRAENAPAAGKGTVVRVLEI